MGMFIPEGLDVGKDSDGSEALDLKGLDGTDGSEALDRKDLDGSDGSKASDLNVLACLDVDLKGGDWSGLAWDVLLEIAGRLPLVEDFKVFRSVCPSWRVPKDVFGAKFGSLPLLMLAENDGDRDHERKLYSISKRRICGSIYLPQSKGKRCVGARFGWLLIMGLEGEMSLASPISGAQINLPNFRTAPGYIPRYNPENACINRAMLTVNPSDDSSTYMLIVVFADKLGFWRPGQDTWKWVGVSSRLRFPGFQNLGYCDDKFYAVDWYGSIWALEPNRFDDDGDDDAARIIVTGLEDHFYMKEPYLAESSNKELILVLRDGRYVDRNRDYSYGARNFDLIKIDVVNGGWKFIKSLDEDAIFIGFSGTFTVCGSDAVKPNSIYFTDDCYSAHFSRKRHGYEPGSDIGVYNVQNKSFEHFSNVTSNFICPPMWVDSSILIKD